MKMKQIVMSLLLLIGICAYANGPTAFTAKDGYAMGILSVLNGSGLALQNKSNGIYEIVLNNVVCDLHPNQNLEPKSPKAGIETTRCVYNADPKNVNLKKGTLIKQSIAFLDSVSAAIKNVDPDAAFIDCGMGTCRGELASVVCAINTNVEEFYGKNRFTCVLTQKSFISE
jgi:hypothetical protein